MQAGSHTGWCDTQMDGDFEGNLIRVQLRTAASQPCPRATHPNNDATVPHCRQPSPLVQQNTQAHNTGLSVHLQYCSSLSLLLFLGRLSCHKYYYHLPRSRQEVARTFIPDLWTLDICVGRQRRKKNPFKFQIRV